MAAAVCAAAAMASQMTAITQMGANGRRGAWPSRATLVGIGARRYAGKGLPGWQVRSQITQVSPCLGRVGRTGPVVELLQVEAADRVCIAEYLRGTLPVAV